MLKIRRPLGRLIFNMGIAIPGKTVFLIETAPWSHTAAVYQCSDHKEAIRRVQLGSLNLWLLLKSKRGWCACPLFCSHSWLVVRSLGQQTWLFPSTRIYTDRLVQERCYSIASALALRLSCINPSISYGMHGSSDLTISHNLLPRNLNLGDIPRIVILHLIT